MNPLFARFLVRCGHVTAHEALLGLEQQFARRPLLGELSVSERLLSLGQVAQVIEAQRTCQRRFGELAVEMGFLSPQQVLRLLQQQEDETPELIEILIERGGDRAKLEGAQKDYGLQADNARSQRLSA